MEEKEKRLLRELEKENVAEAGMGEGDGDDGERKKKERNLLVVRVGFYLWGRGGVGTQLLLAIFV